MTPDKPISLQKRYSAALLLCVVTLPVLCSCGQKTPAPTPPVQSVTMSAPSPARVLVKPPPTVIQAGPVVHPHVDAHDLPNFHVVTPMLLRGAAPTPEGLEALQKMGVKTVIDLRIAPKTVAKEHAQLDQMGMHFVNYPLGGDIPPTEKQIQAFLKIVQDPAQQPVFVHCQHGADRTGTMIGIYRENVAGWPYDKTYKEMLQYGFNPKWTKLSAVVQHHAPPSPPH